MAAGLSGPAVRVDRLAVVRGGKVVLSELSCEVAPGTVTGLLGPSGSGKSTLIRSIVGVQQVAGGRVEVLGHPAGSRALRARVGYMTQAPSVYGDLTARENLRFFARVLGRRGDAVDRALAAVSLDDHADRVVDRLSGGQRARVSDDLHVDRHDLLTKVDEAARGASLIAIAHDAGLAGGEGASLPGATDAAEAQPERASAPKKDKDKG